MSIFGGWEKGFVWFVGVVVDVLDPDKQGRVKVRIYDEHGTKIEDSGLLWAKLVMPPTNTSKQGKGWSPTGIEVDTHVVGFYLDGSQKTMPMILGSFHLQNRGGNGSDVNKIATGESKIDKDYLEYEPKSTAEPVYPFNKVYQSTTGHVIEIDDTPGNERIHVYHKSGAYIEIDKDGDMVTKARDNTEITVGNKTMVIDAGDLLIQTINGNIEISAKGNVILKSNGVVALDAPLVSING